MPVHSISTSLAALKPPVWTDLKKPGPEDVSAGAGLVSGWAQRVAGLDVAHPIAEEPRRLSSMEEVRKLEFCGLWNAREHVRLKRITRSSSHLVRGEAWSEDVNDP